MEIAEHHEVVRAHEGREAQKGWGKGRIGYRGPGKVHAPPLKGHDCYSFGKY